MYKEFDIERAKKGGLVLFRSEISVYFNTTEWRETRIICFDRQSREDKYPIVALVKAEFESPCIFDIYGFDPSGHQRLFMAPVKRQEWVNIARNSDGRYWIDGPYADEKKSQEDKNPDFNGVIKTVSFEWEE